MSKKILILSASPLRDKYIDDFIAIKLRAMGNEVWVKDSPTDNQTAPIEIQPNVVVLPPVRNPYARDYAEQLKSWGMGVVVRHTEPSCDKADYDKMSMYDKQQILGAFPYVADMEIVWGKFEAEILNTRGVFPCFAVGSFSVSLYKNDILERKPRDLFNKERKLKDDKKNLVIGCAWGFIDSAPDRRVHQTAAAQRDLAGRDEWIKMIKEIYAKFYAQWNIIVTLHPSVEPEYYKKAIEGLDICYDVKSPSFDLLTNADCLIHAGSTMGVAMHVLNKPAFQYGDQNVKEGGWWLNSEASISKISPKANSLDELVKMLEGCPAESNASPEGLKILEEGRYGSFDGLAIDRTAELINKVNGQFKVRWPHSWRNYEQITVWQDYRRYVTERVCGICGYKFYIMNDTWLKHISQLLESKKDLRGTEIQCPHCGYSLFLE